MKSSSSISGKTVRPGSLNNYSYYYSGRKKPATAKKKPVAKEPVLNRTWKRRIIGLSILIIIIAAVAGYGFMSNKAPAAQAVNKPKATPAKATVIAPAPAQKTTQTPAVVAAPKTTPVVQPVPPGPCGGNKLSHLLVVGIGSRHIWACQAGSSVYDSPVITGMSAYAATVTPTGTYHIYSMQTNTVLRGSDASGSWVDPVSYWMPFLSNQYGIYGLHDATWRDNSTFGNVDPSSSDASHGCVELPIAAAAWIYNWASVGTTLLIES